MTKEEMMQAALAEAKAAQEREGMIQLPDGNWYDYGTSKEEYLTSQCAMVADQNIRIDAETLYAIQPGSDIRYSEQEIQQWLDRHPHYGEGQY